MHIWLIGKHCLHMWLIATEFHGNHVCTCTYVYWWRHKLAMLMRQLAFCLSECYSMPSSSWVPQEKAQERTGYLHWVHLPRKYTFLRLSSNFGKSISTTAYQTFLIVSDSIKLGRACNSDVYSILRTKAEVIFYDGLCYSHETLIVILVHTSNSATQPLVHAWTV